MSARESDIPVIVQIQNKTITKPKRKINESLLVIWKGKLFNLGLKETCLQFPGIAQSKYIWTACITWFLLRFRLLTSLQFTRAHSHTLAIWFGKCFNPRLVYWWLERDLWLSQRWCIWTFLPFLCSSRDFLGTKELPGLNQLTLLPACAWCFLVTRSLHGEPKV